MAGYGGNATYIAAATAADVDRFVVSTDQKVGAYTVAVSGAMPTGGAYLITASVTAVDTEDTTGTLALVGTDLHGVAQSETITPEAGSTISSTNYYKTVTSVTGVGWVVDGVEGNEDTITVGCGAAAACHVGDGVLQRVIVGEAAAGAITIADSTGTLAVLKASIGEGVYDFDLAFVDYLTVVGAAATKITVVTS